MNNKFLLPEEGDAIQLVRAMSQIIDRDGRVTVADVKGLLGLTSVYIDEQIGWKTTNHVLQPADNGNVSLEFPEPIDFRNESAPVRPAPETIRIVFEIENRTGVEGEQDILDAFNETRLRLMAKATSFNKRPSFAPGPRVRYSSAGRSFGEDDI